MPFFGNNYLCTLHVDGISHDIRLDIHSISFLRSTLGWKFEDNVCFGNSLRIVGVDWTEHALSENIIVLSSKEKLKQISGYETKFFGWSIVWNKCEHKLSDKLSTGKSLEITRPELLDCIIYVLPKQRIWEALSHFRNSLAVLVIISQDMSEQDVTQIQVRSLKVVAA